MSWLEAGVPDSEKSNYASPASAVDLYADFLICPTEPLVKGAVQHAEVKSASHRRYVQDKPVPAELPQYGHLR